MRDKCSITDQPDMYGSQVKEVLENSQSTSTLYFFRVVVVFAVVVVFVVVVTVTSEMVVPNPSSLVSVCWWEQVQCSFPEFPSYGGRELDTDGDPASNFTGINFQNLHGSCSLCCSSCTYSAGIIMAWDSLRGTVTHWHTIFIRSVISEVP